jgi:hypothetical protein
MFSKNDIATKPVVMLQSPVHWKGLRPIEIRRSYNIFYRINLAAGAIHGDVNESAQWRFWN